MGNDTQALTLTEFLLARIAEDEAERVTRYRKGYLPTPRELREAARWEAECDAKRRIIAELAELRATIPAYVIGDGDEHELVIAEWVEATVLPTLAAIYADHPDYREEWAV